MSAMVYIVCFVPQASGLGLRLFVMYTADLSEVVKEHDVSIHAFADNTQLYQHCLRTETAATIARFEQCLLDVSHWLPANCLKLNPDKTEFFLGWFYLQPVVAG